MKQLENYNYESPCIEVIEIRVEKGFATSTIEGSVNPTFPELGRNDW